LVPKAAKFSEITQNNGHYIIQGHSRSPILVPIESPCTSPCKKTAPFYFCNNFCHIFLHGNNYYMMFHN